MPVRLRIAHAWYVLGTHARAVALLPVFSRRPDLVLGYGCLLSACAMAGPIAWHYGHRGHATTATVFFVVFALAARRSFLRKKEPLLSMTEQLAWVDKQTPQIQHWHAGLRQPLRQSQWTALQRLAADAEGLEMKVAQQRANHLKATLLALDDSSPSKARL